MSSNWLVWNETIQIQIMHVYTHPHPHTHPHPNTHTPTHTQTHSHTFFDLSLCNTSILKIGHLLSFFWLNFTKGYFCQNSAPIKHNDHQIVVCELIITYFRDFTTSKILTAQYLLLFYVYLNVGPFICLDKAFSHTMVIFCKKNSMSLLIFSSKDWSIIFCNHSKYLRCI